MRSENIIELDRCIHGHLYRLDSRNLRIGVYNSVDRGFTGIRYKFGDRFLDSEYHWDYEDRGTASPIEDLGKCPIENVTEFDNKELFEWLDSQLKLYPEIL